MRLFQSKRQKTKQSARTGKRGIWPLRHFVRHEGKHHLWLLPYLYTLFSLLWYPHPGLHFLVATSGAVIVGVLLCGLIEHLFQIWTQDPFAPLVPFPWKHVYEVLWVFLPPLLVLAVLMLLSHYPW